MKQNRNCLICFDTRNPAKHCTRILVRIWVYRKKWRLMFYLRQEMNVCILAINSKLISIYLYYAKNVFLSKVLGKKESTIRSVKIVPRKFLISKYFLRWCKTIDILVGINFYYSFKNDEIIRGKTIIIKQNLQWKNTTKLYRINIICWKPV